MRLQEAGKQISVQERRAVTVQGIVQGVGFRPFVHTLARRHKLAGWVRNGPDGVQIEVEGAREALEAFLRGIVAEAPPLTVVEAVSCQPLAARGERGFRIEESLAAGSENGRRALIAPDVATCEACLRELFDPADRRYRYPFINCTNCGPRFTIIRSVPYDRERTTMAQFPMCAACQREYNDPRDRRFHAEPNACPACGPHVALLDASGAPLASDDPIATAAAHLQAGAIVAIKGLGGYHLAVDAAHEEAVARLRARKRREEKSFAIMACDLDAVRELCVISEAEEALLLGPQRPIVLLRRRDLTPRSPSLPGKGKTVARGVAPGNRCLGIMLPYTPLHHLLLAGFARMGEGPAAIVLTSGNVSEEPIAYEDGEALERLGSIADFFLVHDRPIQTRCDDSIVRSVPAGSAPRKLVIRRSRGFAPQPVPLSFSFPEPVLACGAHLKNTFCLGKERHAIVSHHIGDLENVETLRSFSEGIEQFQRLFDIEPAVVAYDLHPEYLATRHALELPGVRRVGVQHHHAHIAGVMAEHGVEGPVIGVAFDGTGYGLDGRIWGAEFLLADRADFVRAAHLEYVPLPGGEQAIRQPWRLAATYLYRAYGEPFLDLDLPMLREVDRPAWRVLRRMIESGTNSPLASSMGRLFDAVASLVTGRGCIAFEGQAAIELEMLADPDCTQEYRFGMVNAEPRVIQAAPVIRAVVEDLRAGVAPETVAARFHNGVAALVAQVCRLLRDRHRLDRVALSGGVFQNALLLERALARLNADGFEVYINSKVPPNDGGISLGQAAVAAARMGETECAWQSPARSSRLWTT